LTIRVTVTHSANTALHHTEWLKVTVNQKEVARWDYTSNSLPEAAGFTKEIKLKAVENMEITAQASCNNHGSQGPTMVKVTVRE
jgi:desulfoferrodoxin (superoxide reductase-like protein)